MINKAIIVTRHVGRRRPTTNQRKIRMFELMMMMMVIIVPLIIIIIIIGMSMSIPNTQSRPSNAGGTSKKTRTHTMPHGVGEGEPPQADPPLDHTTTERGEATHITPRGGGGGGGRARPNRDHM